LVLEVDGSYKPFFALTLTLSRKREREFFRYHPHPAPPPSRGREFHYYFNRFTLSPTVRGNLGFRMKIK
jgi:hypothetical protein